MDDKQILTLINGTTDILSQGGREYLMLIDGFGESGNQTQVVAALKNSKDLDKKFIMLMQSAVYNSNDIDFKTLYKRITKEAKKRNLI
ncbi:MAG: hypothetical protein IKZ53_07395 [Selenomonadaceae bacterium]|nr:hypothetical protein [Selenomonadaceae bacterium]